MGRVGARCGFAYGVAVHMWTVVDVGWWVWAHWGDLEYMCSGWCVLDVEYDHICRHTLLCWLWHVVLCYVALLTISSHVLEMCSALSLSQ